ncbi:MAG: DNA primase regulatory subunit PriL [Thermoprotei archaeon]|nr:MAG: DNA primase regulatory subunit PriL [Thermoprotei archaeon]
MSYLRVARGWERSPISFYDLVKYPFLREAVEYFRARGLTLSDLETDVGRRILERAYERIEEAIRHRRVSTDLSLDPEIELLSFPVALLLLSALGDGPLIHRYATAESKRVGELLKGEDLDKLLWIARETFGWDVRAQSDGEGAAVAVHFANYVSHIPQASREWKLVNRRLTKGYVLVSKSELARLLEEAVKRYIVNRCSKTLSAGKLPNAVAECVSKLSALWSRHYSKLKVEVGAEPGGEDLYPPCIRKLLEDLRSGKNLPHAARFALATFLLNIGYGVEEVLALFRTSPDFNERVARYQVEHLAGLRGSRVKYLPYKCANMRSLGLCADPEGRVCGRVSHPLQYYIRRARGARRGEGAT